MSITEMERFWVQGRGQRENEGLWQPRLARLLSSFSAHPCHRNVQLDARMLLNSLTLGYMTQIDISLPMKSKETGSESCVLHCKPGISYPGCILITLTV